VKTGPALDAKVGDVYRDHPHDVPPHESFVRHPIRSTVEEAAHVREVVDEGTSPATPALIAGAVLALIIPLTAILIFLDFGIAHFA
jgi:hypothetical protein